MMALITAIAITVIPIGPQDLRSDAQKLRYGMFTRGERADQGNTAGRRLQSCGSREAGQGLTLAVDFRSDRVPIPIFWCRAGHVPSFTEPSSSVFLYNIITIVIFSDIDQIR